jgi:hypothetical protein
MKFKKLGILFFSFSVYGLEKKNLLHEDFLLIESEPPIEDFVFLEDPLPGISQKIQEFVQVHDGKYYQITNAAYKKDPGIYGVVLNSGFCMVPYFAGITVFFTVETTAKTLTDNDIVKILFNLSGVGPSSDLKNVLASDDICMQVLERVEKVGREKKNLLDPHTFISDFKDNTLLLETHIPINLYFKNKHVTLLQ